MPSFYIAGRERPLGAVLAPAGFSPACSQCSSFLARATNVTLTADKQNYSDLICGLVSDGVWSKLDALYVFAAVDRTTAKLNLVQNAFNGTENGTISFSAYHGYTGDGSTFAFDSGLAPSSASGQFAQDSSSIGVYILTSNSNTTFPINQIGANQSQDSVYDGLVLRPGSGTADGWLGHGGVTWNSAGAANGFWALSRNAVSSITMYFNGTSVATNSSVDSGLEALSIAFFASTVSGGYNFFDNLQYSAGFIGGGLSGTDVSHLSSRLNTYMTSYGINQY